MNRFLYLSSILLISSSIYASSSKSSGAKGVSEAASGKPTTMSRTDYPTIQEAQIIVTQKRTEQKAAEQIATLKFGGLGDEADSNKASATTSPALSAAITAAAAGVVSGALATMPGSQSPKSIDNQKEDTLALENWMKKSEKFEGSFNVDTSQLRTSALARGAKAIFGGESLSQKVPKDIDIIQHGQTIPVATADGHIAACLAHTEGQIQTDCILTLAKAIGIDSNGLTNNSLAIQRAAIKNLHAHQNLMALKELLANSEKATAFISDLLSTTLYFLSISKDRSGLKPDSQLLQSIQDNQKKVVNTEKQVIRLQRLLKKATRVSEGITENLSQIISFDDKLITGAASSSTALTDKQ